MTRTVHLIVRGRVQGVGFRAFVLSEAQRRGVTGWVRNRRDGSVEAVLQGTPDAVDAVADAVHRGPSASRVTDVQASEGEGVYTNFELRPTV